MRHRYAEFDVVFVLMFIAILALASVVFWFIPSYFEARAFNRTTGNNVSTWDAMWIELRVQEGVKE